MFNHPPHTHTQTSQPNKASLPQTEIKLKISSTRNSLYSFNFTLPEPPPQSTLKKMILKLNLLFKKATLRKFSFNLFSPGSPQIIEG